MNIISQSEKHKVESAGVIYTSTKEDEEREWRDSELLRTDKLVTLPDYPRDGTDLIAYRAELADYPQQLGFPDSARPKQSDYTI